MCGGARYMTPEQQIFFNENGYLCLRGALARNQVEPVKDHVFSELKRLKVWSAGKSLSASIKGTPAFQQVTKLAGMIKVPERHAGIVTPVLRAAIDAFAGAKLDKGNDVQLLISLPDQGKWTLHGLNWHVDVSSPRPDRLPGVQVFALIDDVAPHGGATLALARSHLLGRDEKSRGRIREVLKSKGDVDALLLAEGLPILEMSGRAGDVYLMDMRLLHTPSINATKHVRVMATARFLTA
jgi:hypothetical protein